MNSIAQVLLAYSEKLAPLYGLGEAKSLGLIALEECLSISRTQLLLADKDSSIESKARIRLEYILQELLAHKPLQYILGKCSFYGLELKLSPAVLIPRPETEELVSIIINRFSQKKGMKILDVGTGSGCIALALAKHLEGARVTAIDLSGEAIQVARANAEALSLSNCHFVEADMHSPTIAQHIGLDYDLLVSNPPYIMPSEAASMSQEVLYEEPHTALFAPASDPLICYRSLAALASSPILSEGASIYAEINPLLATETLNLWKYTDGLCNAKLLCDCSNKERFVCADKENKL